MSANAEPIADRAPVRWMGLRLGPLLMVLAGLSFTLMVSLVQIARAEMSFIEVVFWRGVVAVPIAMVWAWGRSWVPTNAPVLGLRVLFGFLAMSCYFFAARGLLITDLSLLGKLQPLVIAVLAPVVLGRREGGGVGMWVLLVVGLIGTAILLAPELQIGSVYGIAALGATLFSGLAHLCIRRLTATDHPAVIVLYFQLGVTLLALPFLAASSALPSEVLGAGFALPPVHLLLPLLGIGVFAFVGQMLMTFAYKADRAPVVAIAGYTTPIWAVLVDIMAFSRIPGWNAFLGGIIVVGAGLWLVVRKR